MSGPPERPDPPPGGHPLDLPQAWFAGFVVLTWLIGRVWPVEVAQGRAAGGCLVLAGVALIGGAVWQMRRRRTTVMPHRDPQALVTGGVFALSRNPIYLGNAVILAGLSLAWAAPQALVLVPVFMILISVRFITGEEARIRARFGAEFDRYCDRTRRWL